MNYHANVVWDLRKHSLSKVRQTVSWSLAPPLTILNDEKDVNVCSSVSVKYNTYISNLKYNTYILKYTYIL